MVSGAALVALCVVVRGGGGTDEPCVCCAAGCALALALIIGEAFRAAPRETARVMVILLGQHCLAVFHERVKLHVTQTGVQLKTHPVESSPFVRSHVQSQNPKTPKPAA